MRMDGLARLHASMRQVGIERMRFRVRHGPLTFDGLFLADTKPYELALGALGHPDIALVFDVRDDYTLKPYFGDAYGPLAAALNLGAGTGQPLMPGDLLRALDAALPTTATRRDAATPTDVARVYRDVEDAHKVHFCGWRDNTIRGDQVRPANLIKTRRCFGQVAHDLCKRRNLSSCWTDDARRAQAYFPPDAR